MEGYLNLFANSDTSNNKPHFKGFLKIDGVEHEFALWPSKSGKGFSGKYKPKGIITPETQALLDEQRRQADTDKAYDEIKRQMPITDEIPF